MSRSDVARQVLDRFAGAGHFECARGLLARGSRLAVVQRATFVRRMPSSLDTSCYNCVPRRSADKRQARRSGRRSRRSAVSAAASAALTIA